MSASDSRAPFGSGGGRGLDGGGGESGGVTEDGVAEFDRGGRVRIRGGGEREGGGGGVGRGRGNTEGEKDTEGIGGGEGNLQSGDLVGEAGVTNGPVTMVAGSRSDSERHSGSVTDTAEE